MNKKVILFGASLLGELALELLSNSYNICFFSDNNESKWGTDIKGIKILPPAQLPFFSEYTIIITSMFYKEIEAQLKDLALTDIYVFFSEAQPNFQGNYTYSVDKLRDINDFRSLFCPDDFLKFQQDYHCIFQESYEECQSINIPPVNYDSKNVLIFAYTFPPIGGPSVQRTLKYIKYLKKMGWNPIVVTTGNCYDMGVFDASLLEEIPEDVTIIRIDHNFESVEKFPKHKLQWIVNLISGIVKDKEEMEKYLRLLNEDGGKNRDLIFFPDIQVQWVIDVMRQIDNIIDFSLIQVIYCSVAPMSAFCLGYYLSFSHNIPWVVDFRDEWTYNTFDEEVRTFKKETYSLIEKMEQNILNSANKVIAINSFAEKNYIDLFHVPPEKVTTITNGYDEEDFVGLDIDAADKEKFTIKHNGTVYLEHSRPFVIINAVNELLQEGKISKNDISLEFRGLINTAVMDLKAKDEFDVLKILPYTQHRESLKDQCKCHLLLVFTSAGEQGKRAHRGKLFECIRLMRRILLISPKGGVADQLVTLTKTGRTFENDDLAGIKEYILECFLDFKNGKKYEGYDMQQIQQFTRENLTKKLARVLDDAASLKQT